MVQITPVKWFAFLICLLLVCACAETPAANPASQPELRETSSLATVAPVQPTTAARVQPTTASPVQPTTSSPVQPTTAAPPSPTAVEMPLPAETPTETAVPAPLLAATTYQVVFVDAQDVLNVRSAPGINNNLVGSLAPDADGISITGPGSMTAGSIWVPIEYAGLAGWVNSRFLTTTIDAFAFCKDTAVLDLVEMLETAVQTKDSSMLAQLVHPNRGLRLRHDWWNPEIRIEGAELMQLFTSNKSYDWGVDEGSGEPVIGPFQTIILPLLENDLLPTNQKACHELLSGSTAGIVRLPDGYADVSFYSSYRPAADTLGFDWGTWAIGIEQWQGSYYLSFLVHYRYEI